jgi:colanic acid biosynthesis glycosyl transferase WcaI
VRTGKRDSILIICQVYAPDPAAVGQQVTDAAEELARRGWRVVVYTAARGYDDPGMRYRSREVRNGVDVRRLPLSSFGKSSIAVRLLAQSLFMVQAVVRGLLTRRLAAVIVSTSPPFAGAGGTVVSWLRRVPLVWWVMDLNPDQMIAAGKTRPSSLVARVFDFLNRLTIRRAACVVVLDRFMAERVSAKRFAHDKVRVIPPWPHVASDEVDSAQVARFRARHGIDGKFVVMYSGNHAMQHPLDTLLAAAARLASDDRFRFVFIGGGAGKAAVEEQISHGARNIVSLPFLPLGNVAESLPAADVHVVTMGDEVVGIVHPCKIYGALAVGRPVLFFGPDQSHGGDLLRGGGVGWRIAHGDVDAAVAAIRQAACMAAEDLGAMGRQASRMVAGSLSRASLCGEFCDMVGRVVSGYSYGFTSGESQLR